MDDYPRDKIVMYVTSKDGEGHVMKIGEYDSIEDIKIHTNMFAADVVIDFFYEAQPITDDND